MVMQAGRLRGAGADDHRRPPAVAPTARQPPGGARPRRLGRRGGPVVLLGRATHHARWATKTDTTADDAFRSVGGSAVPPEPPRAGDRP
jgi:hypothetical protein